MNDYEYEKGLPGVHLEKKIVIIHITLLITKPLIIINEIFQVLLIVKK